MKLSNAIELYMNRRVDFLNEVLLYCDHTGHYIKKWNITEKTKPKEADILSSYNETDYINQIGYIKSDKQRIEELEARVATLEGSRKKIK